MARIKYYNNETGKWEYADSAFSGANVNGGGLNDTARNLLITLLENAVFTSNQTGNIAALKEALEAGGGSGGGNTGGGETPDEPDEPVVVDNITVTDGIMTIVSVGSEITVSDSAMTIA